MRSLHIILVDPSSYCSEIDLARCHCDTDIDDTANDSYFEETVYEVAKTFANDGVDIVACKPGFVLVELCIVSY